MKYDGIANPITGQCHPLTHLIGDRVDDDDDECWYHYYDRKERASIVQRSGRDIAPVCNDP